LAINAIITTANSSIKENELKLDLKPVSTNRKQVV
jgi:hypothetical protein